MPGPKGERGERGPMGPPGYPGSKGERGYSAALSKIQVVFSSYILMYSIQYIIDWEIIQQKKDAGSFIIKFSTWTRRSINFDLIQVEKRKIMHMTINIIMQKWICFFFFFVREIFELGFKPLTFTGWKCRFRNTSAYSGKFLKSIQFKKLQNRIS